jgi:rare lipoprotein A
MSTRSNVVECPSLAPRGRARRIIYFAGLWLIAAAIAANAADTVAPKNPRYGLASYYGKGLQGKETADGETFDKNAISAAHPTYPLGTVLRVTNLRNGRAVDVRINDRGPVRKHQAQGVIIDLSERAAYELGFKRQGRTRVKTEVIEWGRETAKTAAAQAAN